MAVLGADSNRQYASFLVAVAVDADFSAKVAFTGALKAALNAVPTNTRLYGRVEDASGGLTYVICAQAADWAAVPEERKAAALAAIKDAIKRDEAKDKLWVEGAPVQYYAPGTLDIMSIRAGHANRIAGKVVLFSSAAERAKVTKGLRTLPFEFGGAPKVDIAKAKTLVGMGRPVESVSQVQFEYSRLESEKREKKRKREEEAAPPAPAAPTVGGATRRRRDTRRRR
jgi:hypothetical protein